MAKRKSSLAHVGRLPIESGHKVPSAAASVCCLFVAIFFFAVFRLLLAVVLVSFASFSSSTWGPSVYKWQRAHVSRFSLRWTLARVAHTLRIRNCGLRTELRPPSE